MLKSRKELLHFISHELKTPITSMESFSDGIVYAKLLATIYEDFPINKIRGTTMEAKFRNVKILQTFMARKGLGYCFRIERVLKGSAEEILYLTQFICNLVVERKEEGENSFVLKERRLKAEDKENLTFQENISGAKNNEKNNEKSNEKNIEKNTEKTEDFNAGLSRLLNGLEKERDFYFKKCLKIEKLIKKNTFVNKKEIEEILYAEFNL